ncbi:MAG: site-specific DNA-methyltransferase [Planctomycetota bacterium]|nr:site-specific DNA-methyltransferase [Planctomycetota bacterium]
MTWLSLARPIDWGLRDYGTASWEGGDAECDHKQSTARNDGGRENTDGFHGSSSPDSDKGAMNYRGICDKCGARRIDQQIGLEATPDEYVAKMVEVFAEVKRVLADHGTLWLNLGDSYVVTQGGRQAAIGELPKDGAMRRAKRAAKSRQDVDVCGWSKRQTGSSVVPPASAGLKPKDLCGMPWRVALALQADGWYLRSAMPWVKRSAMPESCTDRPASALEYVFLLTKQPRYWYDAHAVRQKGSGLSGGTRSFRNTDLWFESVEAPHGLCIYGDEMVGLDVNPQAMKESHFATFAERLVRPLILAGCPQEVCRACGKPRERIVERKANNHKSLPYSQIAAGGAITGGVGKNFPDVELTTVGWTDCGCGAGFRTGIVLDCFGGSATVGVVAAKLKRDYILIELSVPYTEIAQKRLDAVETGVPVKESRNGQLALFSGD